MNPTEAHRERMVQITPWDKPTVTIVATYGLKSYAEWCEGEATRVRESGRQAEVVTGTDGRISVFVQPATDLLDENVVCGPRRVVET